MNSPRLLRDRRGPAQRNRPLRDEMREDINRVFSGGFTKLPVRLQIKMKSAAEYIENIPIYALALCERHRRYESNPGSAFDLLPIATTDVVFTARESQAPASAARRDKLQGRLCGY